MLASQTIIFASGDARRFVGRSAGIDDVVAESLLEQAPTLSDLMERRAECLTYQLLPNSRLSWSRTVYYEYDDPEHTFEGAMTTTLVLNAEQLAGFRHNPALLAFVAQSEGVLFLSGSVDGALPQVELPDSSMFEFGRGCLAVETSGFDRLRRAMEIHHSVALVDVSQPMLFLAAFMSKLDEEERIKLSFSVGSMFIQTRPRRLLIYPRVTEKARKTLSDAQIRTMSFAELAGQSPIAR